MAKKVKRLLGIAASVLYCAGILTMPILGAEDGETLTPAKIAAPTGDSLKEATRLVTAVFKTDVSTASTPALRGELSRKMLEAGRQEADAAGKFVILSMARDMAIEAGDIDALRPVIEELDRNYAIDRVKLAAEAVGVAAKNVRSAEQRKALADWCPVLLEGAIEADRYDTARSVAELYQGTARSLNDAALQKEAAGAVLRVRELESGLAVLKKALEVLAENPADADANLKAGRFRCFLKGDWENGLPMLAQGSDKMLAALAKGDMALADEAAEQVKVADGWFSAAQGMGGSSKVQVERRALGLYSAALPQLSGPAKLQVEKRVQAMQPAPSSAAPKTAAGPKIDSSDLAAKILSSIPKEMFPTKDDSAEILMTKSRNVKDWIRNSGLVRPGTTATLVGNYGGASMYNVGAAPEGAARGPVYPLRVALRFSQQTDARGIPCKVMLSIARTAAGPDDPELKQVKVLDAAGKSATYAVTSMISEVKVIFTKGQGAPHIAMTVTSYDGAYSAKRR
jgi:hypothetical protein